MLREKAKDGSTILRGGNAGDVFDHRSVAHFNTNYNLTLTAFTALGNTLAFESRGFSDKFEVSWDLTAACTAGAPLTVVGRLMMDALGIGKGKYMTLALNYWGTIGCTQIFTGIPAGAHTFQIGGNIVAAGTALIAGPESGITVKRLN